VLITPVLTPQRPGDWPRTLRIILAGFAAAILGYLPYLTSYFHIMTSQRTYLYAALGATIVMAGVMYALAKIRPAFAVLVAALCLLSGLGSQWEQMVHYTALSHRQRMILAGILEAAPDAALPTSKRLLIVDRSGATSSSWMLRGWELGKALTWFYGAEVMPLVCIETPGHLLSSFLTTAYSKPLNCRESASGWDLVGEGSAPPLHIAKSDTLLLTIEPDGRVTGPTPNPIQPSDSVATRWQSMLGCWPAAACMVPVPDATVSSVRFDFGRYWGLDDAPWGGGWKDEEWYLPSVNPVSWSWIVAPEANLWFKIRPQPGRYTFRMRVYLWISHDAINSLRISLNGNNLEVKPIEDHVLQADFNSSILGSGLNEIRLKADQDPKNGLSVAVDWVSIRPAAAAPPAESN
jgi:hypothetical protein